MPDGHIIHSSGVLKLSSVNYSSSIRESLNNGLARTRCTQADESAAPNVSGPSPMLGALSGSSGRMLTPGGIAQFCLNLCKTLSLSDFTSDTMADNVALI